jgi:hypothetical protein
MMPARREWDTRIVWITQRQKWWWNAWRESTSTELWGLADSPEEALREMTAALKRAHRKHSENMEDSPSAAE